MTFISFKPLLEGDQPIALAWLALGNVAVAEIAAHARPGAVVLDLQHGLWQRDTLEAAVAAAGRYVPVVARCLANQPHHICEALDSGVASVLVPLVESAEEAREAVMACRYPPHGIRSAGGVRPLVGGMAGMLELERQVAVGVMIETVKGVENAEAIAAVPGLDYLFIGTGDLSLSRGSSDPAVLDADCRRVQQAAQARGLPCGLYTGSAQAAHDAFARGYRIAVCGNDMVVANEVFTAAVQTSLGIGARPA